MAYLLQPVNEPYDPEEPMPTPLGFVANSGFFGGTLALKAEFKPVPRDQVAKTIDIGVDRLKRQAYGFVGGVIKAIDPGGDRPMPDFFLLGADHYYVSSRFRAVLERYARGAVEYIEVKANIPANKKPADAYYFINVLGRGELIDWESSNKRGPRKGGKNKRFFVLPSAPDQWAMKTPPPEHPAIWHEVDRAVDDLVYLGSGTRVFVTNALGDALNVAFPGQARLYSIREL